MKAMFLWWSLAILLLILIFASALELEMLDYKSEHFTCSKGLSNCTVKAGAVVLIPKCPVDDMGLKVQPVLCCRQGTACRPCLHIHLDIQLRNHQTAYWVLCVSASYVNVCYNVPELEIDICKILEFTVILAALDGQATSKAWLSLLLKDNAVSFNSQVTVYVCSNHSKVVLPSVDEVCSSAAQGVVEECDGHSLRRMLTCSVPSFSTLIDQESHEVRLQVNTADDSPYPLEMCLQHEDNGVCRTCKESTVPLHSVTPCMCFQVWWNKGDERSHRSISCPFRNHSELLQRNVWENVSVSVVQGQMNNGGAMLSWNLTAPCRVEAEVWPCQKEKGLDMDRCTELVAFRQRLSDDIWRENSRGHWLMPGVFEDVVLGLDLCVMVKVNGKNSELGPFCPIDSSWWHWRWSLLVLLSLMLAVLAAICLYFLHGKLKRWAWEWYQEECGRLANRGHIVLLSPPNVDGSVSELVCELGSSLCAQGFSVSVDLWSRAELCSLGALPWLHSQLQHLDSQGVRAILVLTQAAWERTEDWVRQWDQQGQQGKNIVQGVEKEEGGEEVEGEDKGLLQGLYSPYADVFSAALSCIKADHKLGCAGERFLLVHFEAHSAKPPSSERGLPELFQGLPMFHLPSQSQGLLAELAMGPTGPEAGIGGHRV
ncbi:interleukin-17 receptor C-like isoform X2 [Salvelinus namaycush]|uniref:Interleukin-17 receptor C-like isoform X2 n=1 Tax=Salvelinus namaycush TaxID=8040 RepID=A0A8U1FA74_SALNM|nr:interleukin-17 receptor C-like isoform X2 [Salvelinus namaycush]